MIVVDYQIAPGITVELFIKHTNRKSIGLKLISAKRLEVTAPKKTSHKEIMTIVQDKKGWLLKHIKSLETQDHSGDFVGFNTEQEILLLGKRMPIDFMIDPAMQCNRIRVLKSDHGFKLSSSQPISSAHKSDALNQWSKGYAKTHLLQRVHYFSDKFEITVNNVVIKEQKTRWGSCSSKGNINLNWRLIKAPTDVIDYIVIHELLHRIEMNHSSKFWELVEIAIPTYRHQEEWLKRHHKLLNQ